MKMDSINSEMTNYVWVVAGFVHVINWILTKWTIFIVVDNRLGS